MKAAGGKEKTGLKAQWRRAGLLTSALSLCLTLLAAAGSPLSQLLRVAEFAPVASENADSREAPQYKLVLASAFDAAHAASTAKKANESKSSSPEKNDIRLLKILDEQWETSARVYLDLDVPVLPELPLEAEDSEPRDVFSALSFICVDHRPPNPPARGPPL